MCSSLASAATPATAFGGDYLSEFIDLPTVLVGLAVIGVLALIDFRGIKESVAFFLLDRGGDPGRALDFKAGEAPLLLAVAGASLAFYALIGFEDSVNVAEETQSAPRAFPGTLFAGLAIAGIVYLMVTVIASMAVPTDRLAGSSGPLRGDAVDHEHFRAWTGFLVPGALCCGALILQKLGATPSSSPMRAG